MHGSFRIFNLDVVSGLVNQIMKNFHSNFTVVKLRQGSGKDRQGMAVEAKGLKA